MNECAIVASRVVAITSTYLCALKSSISGSAWSPRYSCATSNGVLPPMLTAFSLAPALARACLLGRPTRA